MEGTSPRRPSPSRHRLLRPLLRAARRNPRRVPRARLERGGMDARVLRRPPATRGADAVRTGVDRARRRHPLGRHRDGGGVGGLHRRRGALGRTGGTRGAGRARPTVNPDVARRMGWATEPCHAVVYFARETSEAYTAIGLKGFWMGYFASRAAPMGPMPPVVVQATFYNFAPGM